MDLSTLLSQAQIIYSKMNYYQPLNISKKKKNHENFVSLLSQNFDLISDFLLLKDIQNLKLACRGVSYLFVAKDLWVGIKNGIAEKKLQDFDDYQFLQEEPKQISKQDKKIRIHSLKKNLINCSLSKKVQRQASNVKQKKIAMSIIDNQFNPFQKTEIGFKRLLKATHPTLIKPMAKLKQRKNFDVEQNYSLERLPQLLEIPAQYSIDDLIINPHSQWIKNVHRAGNLIIVIRKWIMFHSKFWLIASRPQAEILSLIKKSIKIDGCLLTYRTIMSQQPQCTIIGILSELAPKNALIEEQLNKLSQQFLSNYQQLQQIIIKKQTELLITALHEFYRKTSQKINKPALEAVEWAEGLSLIQQGYDNILSKFCNQKFKLLYLKSLNSIFKELIDQHLSRQIYFNNKQHQRFNLKSIYLKFLIDNAEFCQLTFQVLYNCVGKLSNNQTIQQNASENPLTHPESITQNSKRPRVIERETKLIPKPLKLTKPSNGSKPSNKTQKALFGILWNVSKYFDKLQKQIIAKQKKKNEQWKVFLIKQFLQNQGNNLAEGITLVNSDSSQSIGVNGLQLVQDYYKQFKIKIQQLKEQMAQTGIN